MSHKPYKVVSLLLVAKLKNCRKSAALYIYPQMQDPKHKKVICSETVVKQLMKSIKHCYMKSCFFSKFINAYGSAMFPQKICQIKLNKQDISPELKHFYEISVVVELNCLPYV